MTTPALIDVLVGLSESTRANKDFLTGDVQLSFGDLRSGIAQTRGLYASLGVAAGERIAIVTDESNYGHPISAKAKGPWQDFNALLTEQYIEGRELTVAVMGDTAFCVTELKPKAGWCDYEA